MPNVPNFDSRDSHLVCLARRCVCSTPFDEGLCGCTPLDSDALAGACAECGAEMHRIDVSTGEKLAWTVAT